jgi:hypothetical protein
MDNGVENQMHNEAQDPMARQHAGASSSAMRVPGPHGYPPAPAPAHDQFYGPVQEAPGYARPATRGGLAATGASIGGMVQARIPDSVARHPVASAVLAGILSVLTTIGGVYFVQPDLENQIKGLDTQIGAMDKNMRTMDLNMKAMDGNMKSMDGRLQRVTDKHDSRIVELERSIVKVNGLDERLRKCERDIDRSDDYHSRRSASDNAQTVFNSNVESRLNALESSRNTD